MAGVPDDQPLEGVPTGGVPSKRAAAAPVQRVRVTFTKEAAMRFTGHLDVVRLWERATRRARLPLAYTHGFTPHPRFAFAAPLALGVTGERELLEVYFTRELPLDELRVRLDAELPRGCRLVDLQTVPLEAPALMAQVRWAEYRVGVTESLPSGVAAGRQARPPEGARQGDPAETERPAENDAGGRTGNVPGSRWSGRAAGDTALLPTDAELAALAATGGPWRPPSQRLAPLPSLTPLPSPVEIQRRIDAFLAAERFMLPAERGGKTSERDVRAPVIDLWLVEARAPRADAGAELPWSAGDTRLWLGMLLQAGSSGGGRPEEVAAAVGLRARRIHRVRVGLESEPPSRTA